ncbi:neutral/alkaline non-lysosomal ceramidase N-terminal domain-containing protein [Phytoactinopolyspora halotolerans]|uniref:Neutral/alkaline non-lysosomal ceramidase N-terminal domain-containing protein n=1 Tax=Phytoactinopolyspora halotolerans TaxID=1981512 RepID=A0A6L9SG56_9ACTN|nr:neutral/alkaline non-lysosomal ceramidase N-terminal domain-containing protein [Phytoactinopolyspora halotolerans]NEE04335.1 hypothetical protein [Phytoactinopolyspora halotolerans]
MSDLRVGADRVDITPRVPIALAGFAARAELGPATQVSAPLRLRTLTFATGDRRDGPGHDASGRAVLIGADLLWWGSDTADRLRSEISARYGIPTDAILLHATHTHSGPQTSHRFVPLLGEADQSYIDRLCSTAVDSVGRALAASTAVTVERASAPAGLGVDRRWARTRGEVPRVAVDDDATVVRFRRGKETVALLVHYACHPVVHHANAVSSDFCGAAMDELERRHAGAVALYAQGCCGDVNPDAYDDEGRFRDGDQAAVRSLGERLADRVDAALAGECVALDAVSVAGGSWTVELPVDGPPSPIQLRERADEPGLLGQWARLLLADPDRLTSTVPVVFSRLRIASGLTLLGMSAEPVSAYGLQVKADSGGAVLPLGYTNGMTGYLVTAQQLAEGGYEPAEAPYYFGMPGPLAPKAEQLLRDALHSATTRLAQPHLGSPRPK